MAAKWWILILSALTATFTVAAPSMGLSVMFKEISTDLNLDLVQIGLVWSIGSLPAILTAILGGAVADRLGPRRVIVTGIALTGVIGALRGWAGDFASLLTIILFLGALTPLITMTAYKINGMWFPPHQLGLANGIFSMGMALGFMLGAFFSANLISPWLGGWRNTFFFFGGLAILFAIPWTIIPITPPASPTSQPEKHQQSFWQGVRQIYRNSNMWLVGIAMLGYSGAIQGLLGYLPLHLRDAGWTGINADGAQTLFHAMSLVFVIPITFLSDRLGTRKNLLLVTLCLTVAGASVLIFSQSWPVWLAVILAGVGRDATMALLFTMGIQMKGVGAAYAGSASGFVSLFSFVGALLASPIGNSLAGTSAGLPFAFWAGMAALALISLALVKVEKTSQTSS